MVGTAVLGTAASTLKSGVPSKKPHFDHSHSARVEKRASSAVPHGIGAGTIPECGSLPVSHGSGSVGIRNSECSHLVKEVGVLP